MWNVGFIGYSRCGILVMWDFWDVGCWGYEMFGLWDVQDVGCLGFLRFGMWDVGCLPGMWDVDLQNSRQVCDCLSCLLHSLFVHFF